MEASNPKADAATRDSKAPLDLLEHVANVKAAFALKDGAVKYGKKNYRTIPIYASTYIAAIARHAGLYADGEDVAEDSGVDHLAHIMANVHVMYGAMSAGVFVDDRGPQERTPEQEQNSSASNAQHNVRKNT